LEIPGSNLSLEINNLAEAVYGFSQSLSETTHRCFVFRRPWVQILASRLSILTEFFMVFPQSLHANARIIP
jgi:hypothetical protein